MPRPVANPTACASGSAGQHHVQAAQITLPEPTLVMKKSSRSVVPVRLRWRTARSSPPPPRGTIVSHAPWLFSYRVLEAGRAVTLCERRACCAQHAVGHLVCPQPQSLRNVRKRERSGRWRRSAPGP